jgi:YNFM family putative membrane transporter
MSVIYAPQPLLAVIADEFDQTALSANLVVSATTFGIAAGVFPMAWVADRLGRGRTIALALLVGFLATGATAWAPDWGLLVASRLVVGVAISAVLVSALVWVAELVPRRDARRVAALYIAGTTAGGMAGRIVAGLLTDGLGWRWAVMAVDVVVLVCAVLGLALLARYRRTADADGGEVSVERRVTAPSSLRSRLPLYVLGFLGTAIFVGVYNAVAFRTLEPPFELGVGLTSLLFLTYFAGTLSSVRAGAVVDRLGVRATVLIGLGAVLAGLLLTLVDQVAVLVLALLVLSAGFFAVHTALSSTVPLVAPKPTSGSALYTLYYYAGSSVGALLLGYAWDTARWPAVIGVAVALFAVAAVVAAALPRRLGDPLST